MPTARIEARLDVPCDLRKISEAVGFVRDFALAQSCPTSFVGKLSVAAEEAIANAIDHGSSCKTEMQVEIRCMIHEGSFWLVVKDYGGKPFNPDYFLRIATKKIWGKGGRGILMITQIMDSVSYIFATGRSTTLYLSKRLPTGPEEDDE